MKRSYLDYAMSVIVSRALPDVRDGLSRCIGEFHAMHENGYDLSKPYRKSARIVGDVMGATIHMAIRQFTMPWFGWRKNSRCVCR